MIFGIFFGVLGFFRIFGIFSDFWDFFWIFGIFSDFWDFFGGCTRIFLSEQPLDFCAPSQFLCLPSAKYNHSCSCVGRCSGCVGRQCRRWRGGAKSCSLLKTKLRDRELNSPVLLMKYQCREPGKR